jgi:hypothetical protein
MILATKDFGTPSKLPKLLARKESRNALDTMQPSKEKQILLIRDIINCNTISICCFTVGSSNINCHISKQKKIIARRSNLPNRFSIYGGL